MTTMNDIAERTGLSRATVSYVLNGRHQNRLGQETRDRVLAVAEELGYRNNELARAVATGKSRILGILINKDITEAQARNLTGALAEAASRGYSTKILHVSFLAHEQETKRILRLCSSWRLDGALAIGLSDAHIELLRRETETTHDKRPVAFCGVMPPANSVGAFCDDETAWRLAVEYLISLGHRRIAHLGADPTSKLSHNRSRLCLQVLREFGLPVDEHSSTFTCWAESEVMAQGVHRLLDAPERPTAILCPGDALAMITLREAQKRGLSVPQDLSVLGFGNYATSPYTAPSLSSIVEPLEDMAGQAVRELLLHVEGDGAQTSEPDVPFKITEGFGLAIRDSTGPVPRL